MREIGPERVRELTDWGPLIEALAEMFRSGCEAPVRHHHTVGVPGEPDATLLLMPAWLQGRYIGVKVLNVFPGNAARGLTSISAVYLLSSAATGEMLAAIDGGELTARRTAAASALAARHLASNKAAALLMVGTGRLSGNLIAAHARVRSYETITIWGRNPDRAASMASAMAAEGLPAVAVDDLEAAARSADVISCATLSSEPLILGAWLKPGAHLDLVGGFTPQMREADDEAIRRATVFVDTYHGATKEGGDIVQPLESGLLTTREIESDLHGLCHGEHPGRMGDQEITLFKSVGAALEDLAAAILVYEGDRGT